MSGMSREKMQFILKRIRDEVVDMFSRKTIYIPQPTAAEKRKVRYYKIIVPLIADIVNSLYLKVNIFFFCRYFITKCLELMEKSKSLKKMPRNPLELSKKEISDTLTTIHK